MIILRQLQEYDRGYTACRQGEELAVLVVEYQGDEQQQRLELKSRIGRKIRQELGIDCIIELVPRNTINRTTSGKPSRHATKRDYLQQVSARSPLESHLRGSDACLCDVIPLKMRDNQPA